MDHDVHALAQTQSSQVGSQSLPGYHPFNFRQVNVTELGMGLEEIGDLF